MAQNKVNSPLVGYNTNVRHAGHLFHIQTEDSGVEHPHVITHLFTEGTILATKKTKYDHLLEQSAKELDSHVRQMMKVQHKSMFIELRDGKHDEIASQIIGENIGSLADDEGDVYTILADQPSDEVEAEIEAVSIDSESIRVIQPISLDNASEQLQAELDKEQQKQAASSARSIFETPNANGEFGDDFVSDKSLDEVILSYLQDDLDDD